MGNSNYNIVVEYIATEFNLNKSKLSLETSLSDIGLDGDDTLDFLLKFFKIFNIAYEHTNYKNFIPVEGKFISAFLTIFNKKRKQNDNEITVKDLVISLDNKRWLKET